MRRPWIKIETATPDKPEICAIATQLRMDADMVVGKLIRLWSWITVNKISGSDLGVTKEFLDKLVGRKGFADALQAAGWLVVSDGKLSMPHFERHNSDAAKVRALTAQRVKRHRITKELKIEDSEDAVTLNRAEEVSSQEEGQNTATISREEGVPDEVLIEAPVDEVIDADPEPIEEVVMQVPEHEEVSGGEDEQAGEALSINAEPTFRPLDFEDPPPHDNEAEIPAVEFEVPEVGAEAPKVEAEALAPEPTPAKKSKRKADGKQDDQPLLF
jgi:hypothetical protein